MITETISLLQKKIQSLSVFNEFQNASDWLLPNSPFLDRKLTNHKKDDMKTGKYAKEKEKITSIKTL